MDKQTAPGSRWLNDPGPPAVAGGDTSLRTPERLSNSRGMQRQRLLRLSQDRFDSNQPSPRLLR